MYNAPSVSYPVGRCAFQRWVLVGLSAISCVVLVAWALQQPMGWAWRMAAACWLVAVWVGGCAYAFAYSQVMGTLTWSGQVWCLHGLPDSADDMLGEVSVCMDVQGALLLEWTPLSVDKPFVTQWLWLGAENAPKLWQDLRRAVFATAQV